MAAERIESDASPISRNTTLANVYLVWKCNPLNFSMSMGLGFMNASLDFQRRFWTTMQEVDKPVGPPEWTTSNRDVLELPQGTLKDFSTEKSSSNYKVLILPPQAGHSSMIADFAEGQSLVQTALDAGASVYAADWHGASPERRNETIDDFIKATKQMVDKIAPGDEKVTLVGLCQGGWQAAIFASIYPDKVRHLVLAGSPLDFDAGNGQVKQYAKNYPMAFFEWLVAMGGGNMPGKSMLMGWKSMHPWNDTLDMMDLFNHIDDEEFKKRRGRFRQWYEYTQDLPGKAYLQIVKELFKENNLLKKHLKVKDDKREHTPDLGNITCDVTLIAGTKDDITPHEQVFNAESHFGSKKITKHLVNAGHIGLFMANKIIEELWPQVFRDAAPTLRR